MNWHWTCIDSKNIISPWEHLDELYFLFSVWDRLLSRVLSAACLSLPKEELGPTVTYKSLFRNKVFKNKEWSIMLTCLTKTIHRLVGSNWGEYSQLQKTKRWGRGGWGWSHRTQEKAGSCVQSRYSVSRQGWKIAFTPEGLFSLTPFLILEWSVAIVCCHRPA